MLKLIPAGSVKAKANKFMKTKLLMMSLLGLLSFQHLCNAQVPPLGTTSSFAVLTAEGAINNAGPTVIKGDIGNGVGAFNGFPPGIVLGEIHNEDGVAATASAELLSIYGSFSAMTCGSVIGTSLGSGQILTPDIYCLGAASTLNGNLTLDAQGDPNAVFVFKIDGAFATGVMANIILTNSASICNIYWIVNGQFTLADNSTFYGTVINNGAGIILDNAYMAGRLLSVAGAISLNSVLIDNVCGMDQCDTLAYGGTTSVGNQAWPGQLGLFFTVNNAITITQLGVFDDSSDGIASAIEVGIINSAGVTIIGPISISGAGDPLVSNFRMVDIAPFLLIPGDYAVVAVGFNSVDLNGNQAFAPNPVTDLNAGPEITYTGVAYSANTTFGLPNIPELPPNRYHAGTFNYSVDLGDPSIECPSDITISTDVGANTDALAGDCGAELYDIGPLSYSDDCGTPVLSYTIVGTTNDNGFGDASGSFFTIGNSVVTYLVSDNGSPPNTSYCSFTVTVEDTEAPTIQCPANLTVDTDPDLCSAVVDYEVLFADNCTGVYSDGFVGEFEPGNWSLTNSNGGNGSVETSGAPATITINGSDLGGVNPSGNTEYCIQIPGTFSGEMSFVFNYTTFDSDGPAFDKFGYSINGVFTQLSDDGGGQFQAGSVALSTLDPGDEFCFVIISTDQGFGPAVTIAMNFNYNESINPDLIQDLGVASGGTFPIGVTLNTYTVTDNNDNTASCSFFVTVEDNQAPVLSNCPQDVTVQLDPLACTIPVDFLDPTVDDNCPGALVSLVTPLGSGADFPIGTSEVIFQATDVAGNTSQCSFNITVLDFINTSLGCNAINVSLDMDCTATITPYMVLTGFLDANGDTILGCLDNIVIDVIAPNGTSLGDFIDGTYLGKTLNYTVTIETADFTCWSTLKIEDKLPPTIDCQNDTISCFEPLSIAVLPIALDNCGASLVLLNQTFDKLICNEEFLGYYIRTYKAVDGYGNSSQICNQIVYVRRTDLSGIDWPQQSNLECNSFVGQVPPTSVTGVPTLNGFSLYPLNGSIYCNGYAKFTDKLIFDTNCKKRITRTWEVGEWWCDTLINQIYVQLIEIADHTPPVIGTLPVGSASTSGHDCTANYLLPIISASDNCNGVTVTVSGAGPITTPGSIVELEVGSHTLIYTAIDGCGNASTYSHTVRVIDHADPIALCEWITVVSLKPDGTAWLDAISVDDGSFDECGPIDLQIRRMTSTCDTTSINWGDQVGFCCDDIGDDVMVVLQVTDLSGNTNQCMVRVEVQDKYIPTMICPVNVTVSCETAYDLTNLGSTFGNPTIVGGGCTNLSNVRERFVENLNSCRIGTLTRTFDLIIAGNIIQTCQQVITFTPSTPFTSSNIVWPRDTVFTNTLCTPANLDPNTLPVGYGNPIILNEGICDLVAFNFEDVVYTFATNACYKVIRTWSVINWCQRNELGYIVEWTHEQVFIIQNTIDPTITNIIGDTIVCSYDAACAPININLSAVGSDDCTPLAELVWNFVVRKQSDNSIVRVGNSNNASGLYPIGQYTITFVVIDKCGNSASATSTFEMRNCKPPTAYCLQGLSTALVPMDTNGDGIADAAMARLTADYFDNGSYHSCGYPVTVSFSSDVNDTVLILTCADRPRKNVTLYATDINGNQSFCTTFIDVINQAGNLCPPTIMVTINGKISTEQNQNVKNVAVKLQSTNESVEITDIDGQYDFAEMEPGGTYKLSPEMDGDDVNGVSTLDLVLVQRHILGVAKLNTPYKMIAADVNKDKKINTLDLVQIRKLVLGSISDFPNNTSWRFVDKFFIFDNPNDPLSGEIQESYTIPVLNSNMEIDWIGVKVGDVNASAKANLSSVIAEPRSDEKMVLDIDDLEIENGKWYSVAINLSSLESINGYQFAMDLKGIEVETILGIDKDNVLFTNAGMRLSVSDVKDKSIVLNFTAKENGRLSEMISINDREMTPESYLGEDINVGKIEMRWNGSNPENDKFLVSQNEPNPWTANTTIKISSPKSSDATLTVRSIDGRLMINRSLILHKGVNIVEINRDDLGEYGLLIYEVETTEGDKVSGRMIHIR